MRKMILAGACVATLVIGLAAQHDIAADDTAPANLGAAPREEFMQIEYLEMVTPSVDSLCATYEALFGVTFSEPVAELGNARTAELPNGGRLGIRAPLRDTEQPVVRPYFLVDDLKAAVTAAEAAGATIALPYMELPGQGTIAIYLQGGIEHGLWQR